MRRILLLDENMRMIIASSGTGGHLFCGLSIAEALRKRVPDIKLFFLNSDAVFIKESVQFKRDYFKAYRMYSAGLTGEGLKRYLRFIFGQTVNILKSVLLFLYIRPKVVFSTGGFAAFGIVLCSWFFRTPCVIHEQNLIPGKVTRISAYFADKILISFSKTKDYLKANNCVYTGMPVRFKSRIPADDSRKTLGLPTGRFTVLVMGGSKGAHRLNQIIIENIDRIPKDIQFIHLTGREDFAIVKGIYKKAGINAYVKDFSTRMGLIYSASDMVISRAGSGSISEINFFGLPAVLVPYPHSRDRHQFKNADFLKERGAAIVIPENEFSTEKLLELLSSGWRDRLMEMGRKSKELAMPFATDRIIDELKFTAIRNI